MLYLMAKFVAGRLGRPEQVLEGRDGASGGACRPHATDVMSKSDTLLGNFLARGTWFLQAVESTRALGSPY